MPSKSSDIMRSKVPSSQEAGTQSWQKYRVIEVKSHSAKTTDSNDITELESQSETKSEIGVEKW